MNRRTEKRGASIRWGTFLAASASTFLVSSAVLAADGACTLGTKTIKLLLRKANPVCERYSVTISVGGGPAHGVQVDTGSSRIMVPRSAVPDELWRKFEKPSHILYSSNGGYNFGKLVNTPVTLGVSRDGKGGHTTGNLDVLVVTCHCAVRADTPASKPYPSVVPAQCTDLNDAAPAPNDKGTSSLTDCVDANPTVGMMGVGFGRGNPMNNAFLRLTAMDDGSMHRGYIIREHAIELGLTEQNTQDFKFIQLSPSTSSDSNDSRPSSATPPAPPPAISPLKGWSEPNGCVELRPPGEPSATFCGKLLMDTGIPEMLLSVPGPQRPQSCVVATPLDKGVDQRVPDTIPMSVTIPGPEAPVLSYEFQPGGQPPAPSYVSWRGANASSVGGINTGRHLLATANYAYDAECGRMGFKQIKPKVTCDPAPKKRKVQPGK